MVEIDIDYEGQLHCRAAHGPSGTILATDAPRDNMGRGESFSPTDLVATALGTCMMTTMGIVAQRNNLDISGAKLHITKEMISQPSRRVGTLSARVTMPRNLSAEDRKRLENAALTCPVMVSLHPDIVKPVIFRWPE